MDTKIDIQDMETRLTSGQLETQIAALKEAREVIESVSKIAVLGFKYTNNPTIYTDMLSPLGQAVVPYLESLYNTYKEGNPKTSIAILLLHMGNKAGLSEVLRALRIEDPNQFLAASTLANAGATDAIEPITNLLREYTFTQPLDNILGPKIGKLINSLTKLGAEIPEDVRKALTAPGVTKFVTAYVPKADDGHVAGN
jgi:hypothetical protein